MALKRNEQPFVLPKSDIVGGNWTTLYEGTPINIGNISINTLSSYNELWLQLGDSTNSNASRTNIVIPNLTGAIGYYFYPRGAVPILIRVRTYAAVLEILENHSDDRFVHFVYGKI